MVKMIVLGNGFDLSSSLKSSYKDFMDYRIPQDKKDILDSFYESTFNITSSNDSRYIPRLVFKNSGASPNPQIIHLESAERIKELTFWDIFLYYKYNKNDYKYVDDGKLLWYNIEEDILDFITTTHSGSDYSLLTDHSSIYFMNTYTDKTLQRAVRVCNALLYNLRLGNDYSNKLPLSFLHDELIEFERAFKKYIFYESQQDDYRKRSTDLFYKIAGGVSEEFYILNFNYTVSLSNLYNVKHRNMHGNIDSNVIFGVDTKNFTPHDEQYVYTKTYRLLTENGFSSPAPLPSDIDSIVFFGHSLSKADYSYFQSLFDYYNLYGSNIKLEFACRAYNDYTKKDITRFQSELLTKLLYEYSKTIPNKAHGENLIHKLILENRLLIKVID